MVRSVLERPLGNVSGQQLLLLILQILIRDPIKGVNPRKPPKNKPRGYI